MQASEEPITKAKTLVLTRIPVSPKDEDDGTVKAPNDVVPATALDATGTYSESSKLPS